MGYSRLYTKHRWKGKLELVSWFQNKCISCGKFLSKHGQKYCPDCYEEKERNRKHVKKVSING